MANWRTITLSDLNAASSSNKVTIIQNAASSRSLPDPAAAAINVVTLELRAAIGFSGKYVLDQNASALPNGLLDLAIKKIVREMTRAVNMPFSQDEQNDEHTYEDRLDKIRTGQWPIDPADTPIATPVVQTSVVVPAVIVRDRQFFRKSSY